MLRFGRHEMDADARELRCDGAVVHLEPQAFDLLVHLMEHHDRVIPKHELLDVVWGHRFVSEAALTTRVKEIRRAVGDDGSQQHTIRNVRGRGYRFVAEIETSALPSQHGSTSRLIGREVLLSEVHRSVARGRCLTLVGPGGVGKSTLVRDLARAYRSHHVDGAHIVELATISATDEVLPAIAQALDLVLDRRRPAGALHTLSALDALVVLDNCEHVVDEVAEVVDRALGEGAATVAFVATSQVRLGAVDEQVLLVDPLDIDAAVDLFVERARAVRRDWDPVDVGIDRVRRLVDHLDRLPLTIEMAAARLGSMTFDDLESAVADGARLLQVTHRAPAARHRTLPSLVSWSTALLTDGQRALLDDFSVFAGAVAATDAAAVLATGELPDVVPELAHLAERSLLAADLGGSETCYRMLETVRLVAAARLAASGRGPALRRRHAAHVTGSLREVDALLRGTEEARGRARLATLVPEVRTAHRWSITHDPVLAARMGVSLHLGAYTTLWNEPAAWSAALLDAHPGREGELVGARLVLAGADCNAGRLVEAEGHVAAVLEGTDEPAWIGVALEILSDVTIYRGELDRSLETSARLADLGGDLGDHHMRGIACVNSSVALTFAERPAEALAQLRAFDPTSTSPTIRAWLAYACGEALSELGDHEASIAAFGDAYELAQAIGNPFVVSVSQQLAAVEWMRLDEPRRALDATASCLRGYLRHGNLVHAVTALRNLTILLERIGDLTAAATLGAAVTGDGLRHSFGAEAQRLGTVFDELATRLGPERFAAAVELGSSLDVESAVRWAADVVDHHRG